MHGKTRLLQIVLTQPPTCFRTGLRRGVVRWPQGACHKRCWCIARMCYSVMHSERSDADLVLQCCMPQQL